MCILLFCGFNTLYKNTNVNVIANFPKYYK